MEVSVLNHKSKHQVIEFIESQNLIGIMNKTKWNEFFHALNEVEELINFKTTYIDGTTWPEPDSTYSRAFELAQVWGNFLALEFIDINAQISHSKGELLAPEVVDHIDEIIKICTSNRVKFCVTDSGVRVYGYIRHGDKVDFHNYT